MKFQGGQVQLTVRIGDLSNVKIKQIVAPKGCPLSLKCSVLGCKVDQGPHASGPALNWTDQRKAVAWMPSQIGKWGHKHHTVCQEDIFGRAAEGQSARLQELGGGWTFSMPSCCPAPGWTWALLPGGCGIYLCLSSFKQLTSTVFCVILWEMLISFLHQLFLKYSRNLGLRA